MMLTVFVFKAQISNSCDLVRPCSYMFMPSHAQQTLDLHAKCQRLGKLFWNYQPTEQAIELLIKIQHLSESGAKTIELNKNSRDVLCSD